MREGAGQSEGRQEEMSRRLRWRGERAAPEVGEKRVQGDNVVERCRKEGSRANKRDMTVSALRLSVLHP